MTQNVPSYCWYSISNVDDGRILLIKHWWKRFKKHTIKPKTLILADCEMLSPIDTSSPLSYTDTMLWCIGNNRLLYNDSDNINNIVYGQNNIRKQFIVWNEHNKDKPLTQKVIEIFINHAKDFNKIDINSTNIDIFINYINNLNC